MRKSISKRTRFSVFARDNFTCVYCGRQPPTVTLEIEHVIPVSQDGTNDETNLRTSCHDCNAGKGAKKLCEIVPTDADRLRQAQELSEKRLQLDELLACQQAADEFRQAIVNRWCEALREDTCKRNSVTIIVNAYNEFGPEVLDWMEMAAERTYSENRAIKYFCGIVRNRRNQGAEGG